MPASTRVGFDVSTPELQHELDESGINSPRIGDSVEHLLSVHCHLRMHFLVNLRRVIQNAQQIFLHRSA
jgi:hypothetical protein